MMQPEPPPAPPPDLGSVYMPDIPTGSVEAEGSSWRAPTVAGGVIDLSIPAPGEATTDSKASGSAGYVQSVAPETYKSVVGLLPERLKPREDVVEAPSLEQVERDRAQQAADRACEGRWVPTYMRHQMADNGHAAIPQMPNAHEFSADQRPPTLGEALSDMGVELRQHAQVIIDMMMATLSTLALHCQLCSHQAAASVHERVMVLGDGVVLEGCSTACGPCRNPEIMSDQEDEEETVLLGPIPHESTANLGPMRSRVCHSLKGVSLDALLLAAKCNFVTPQCPPELRRLTQTREFVRGYNDHEASAEDWLFHTIVDPAVLASFPLDAVKEVCGPGPMRCRERWHVEHLSKHASVEVTSEPAGGGVVVVLRLDIVQRPGDQGCDTDSKLYAWPRVTSMAMPPGLVERLVEAHHIHSESLRDVVLALNGPPQPPAPAVDGSPRTSGGYVPETVDLTPPGSNVSLTPPGSGRLPVVERVPSTDASRFAAGNPAGPRTAPVETQNTWVAKPNAFQATSSEGKMGAPLENKLLMELADGI